MILDREVMSVARLLGGSAVVASVLYAAPAYAGVPDEIRVPGEIPAIALHAEGAQIYECQLDATNRLVWRAREPTATLMDGGNSVGHHYAALRSVPYAADYVFWRAE